MNGHAQVRLRCTALIHNVNHVFRLSLIDIGTVTRVPTNPVDLVHPVSLSALGDGMHAITGVELQRVWHSVYADGFGRLRSCIENRCAMAATSSHGDTIVSGEA